MKFKTKKMMTYTFCISLVFIIIGFFLWTILITHQDAHLLTQEELYRVQQELALHYPLGRFLLYVGFLGFVISTSYFSYYRIIKLIDRLKIKRNKGQ